MKPTLAILTALLIAALPSTANHPADDDAYPEDVEHAICGFPAVKNAVNLLPPDVAHCFDDGNLFTASLEEAEPCATCQATDLVPNTNLPLFGGFVTPPIVLPPDDIPSQGEEIGVIEAYYNPVTDLYCVFFTPTDEEPIPACVDPGPASEVLPTIPPTPVGETPEVPAGSILNYDPDDVPAVSVDVHVEYFHDDSHLNQRALVDDLVLYEPIDYDEAGEPEWWIGNAAGTSVVVTLVPIVGGEPQAPIVGATPLAGQAVAAFQATVDALPEP